MLYDVYDSVKRQIMSGVSADDVKRLGIDIRGKKKFPIRQKALNGLTYSVYEHKEHRRPELPKATAEFIDVPALKFSSGCRFGFRLRKGKCSDIWR